MRLNELEKLTPAISLTGVQVVKSAFGMVLLLLGVSMVIGRIPIVVLLFGILEFGFPRD